jgi:hypothetical protein
MHNLWWMRERMRTDRAGIEERRNKAGCQEMHQMPRMREFLPSRRVEVMIMMTS